MLSPNAIRSNLEDPNAARIAERQDWTRRVETEYEYIVRHGDSPKNYFWEVVDKMGGVRWYGGYPDGGGPFGDAGDDKEADLPTSGTIDKSAILYDDDDNAVQWMLSAQRDVGVNMIRYHYEKVAGSRPDPTDPAVRLTDFGRSIYLSSIEYTGASDASGEPEDAAYRVRFIRDRAGDAKRPDISVDARNGFLEVRSELLRRVEVWYGEPKIDAKGPGPEDDVRVTRTDYDELAVAYDLKYRTGAFSKTLLESVTQSGADGTSATHTFTYYDRVRDAAGTYDGFDDAATWSTSGDTQDLSELLIQERVTSSVLGSSLSDGADVRMYYGFNPTVAPSKQGSIGGSWAVNFAAVEGLTEFIDINGDTLPDKVYRGKGSDEAWKTVYFQLNDGKGSFGAEHKVAGLAKLSNEYSVGVAGAFEAYLAAQVVFMVSGDVAIGDDYFTDVNSDGLIDFVSADTVYFNRLVPSNGTLIPTFQTGSTGTRVPVESKSASLPVIDDLVEAEAARRAQSPLHDTVRRWTAPFGGTVAITGSPVLLEDRDPATIVDGARVPSTYEGDGVRVAIQRNEDDELWTATLGVPGDSANLSDVSDIDVEAGSHIYFRVGSQDDGTGDDVAWFPEIEYTAVRRQHPAAREGRERPVADAVRRRRRLHPRRPTRLARAPSARRHRPCRDDRAQGARHDRRCHGPDPAQRHGRQGDRHRGRDRRYDRHHRRGRHRRRRADRRPRMTRSASGWSSTRPWTSRRTTGGRGCGTRPPRSRTNSGRRSSKPSTRTAIRSTARTFRQTLTSTRSRRQPGRPRRGPRPKTPRRPRR